jgi:ABC-2 type transport system permease protein
MISSSQRDTPTIGSTQPALHVPSVWRLGLSRGAVEIKTFMRERETVVFTFALPVVLLLLLGSIYTGTYAGTGATASEYFAASMLAAGIASTTFVSLGTGVVSDREDGTLKRLRGVPLRPVSYFIGKLILVLAVSLSETVLIIAVGVLLFHMRLPASPGRLATLAWVFLLGAASCSFLGLAASSVVRSVRGAAATMNLPYLVLCFISGIFVTPITAVPRALAQIGAVFPLKWLAQGLRSVFLPDTMASREIGGSWDLGLVALVLAGWCVLGLLLCLTTFRWRGRRDG